MSSTAHQSDPALEHKPNPCHPERSLAMSEANRQTESKDLVPAGATPGNQGN